MPSEFPMNDPQNIWQNQPTEAFKMSADQLRHKAQQRERKSRFEAVYSTIIGLALFVFFAWGCARTHALIPRIGFGVLSLWCAYLCIQVMQRDFAEAAGSRCDARHHGPLLQDRTGEAARLWPPRLAHADTGFPGHGDGYRAGTNSVALRPATVVEFGAVVRASGNMACDFCPQAKARPAEAAAGDRAAKSV